MTVGVSPKAYAAALAAAVTAVLASSYVADLPPWLLAILVGVGAFAAAFAASPGEVLVERGPASDELLDELETGAANRGDVEPA